MEEIDFRDIRPYQGDKRKGFEELICQLARREGNRDVGEFRRVEGAGGDGGVEAYWIINDGTEQGYQAKYFLATKDIDWTQIDKSVKTALEQHPGLTQYTVAIACNLTDQSGRLGRGKTGWEHWQTHKAKWEKWAETKGMGVVFIPWTKFELTDRLVTNTKNRGLVLWWFNVQLFDEEWFRHLFECARADLGERFQPEDHVKVELSEVFDGLSRSEDYINFLSKWFRELPRLSHLYDDLKKLEFPHDDNLLQLENKCAVFREISDSLHVFEMQPLPISDWRQVVQSVENATVPIREWLRGQRTDENETATNAKNNALSNLSKIEAYLDRTPIHLDANHRHEIRVEADLRRIMVVVGEPGSGKSHLFADTVDASLKKGRPAILLLGQHFAGYDIRSEFLHRLDLAQYDFDMVLQALNAAGEVARSRLIILIDALNETNELRIWNEQLAGFIHEILKYEWLAIGVSLRPEYESHLIPEKISGEAARATCRGIQSYDEQERAAMQYFVKRGIVRPAVPWLMPEFSNFLFLKTCCDALQQQGIHEFPRGMYGSMKILKFYLDSLRAKLKKRFPDTDIPTSALSDSVRNIAKKMVEARTNYIDLDTGIRICEAHFGCRGPNAANHWFSILIHEGLLRLDHIFNDDKTDPFADVKDIYRFSYQHFSDHLIVQALLETVPDITSAFQPNGSLCFLIEGDNIWVWGSLWKAMAVQMPEKFAGTELLDVLPNELNNSTDYHLFQDAFEQSLLWRSKDSFSNRTRELFNEIVKGWYDPRLDTLIRLATLQDHPWNAKFIDQILNRFPLAERDSFWTVHINDADPNDRDPLWELINWSLRANLELAETETLRLAAITLTWVFTSSNRPLRDTATKALSAIFISRPQLIPEIAAHFQHVDDLYVMERICAATLGAITRINTDDDSVRIAARTIYWVIFNRESPALNINLRDYARAVIEYALSQGCLDQDINIEKCRPPYHSPWPLPNVTEEELARIAEECGNDEILISTCNSLGDFSRYQVDSLVRHFTNVPLNKPRPLNNTERENEFLEKLALWETQKQEAFKQLKSAVGTINNSIKTEVGKGTIFIIDTSSEEMQEHMRICEEQFTSLLSPDEKKTYEQLALPVLFPNRVSEDDRRIPEFDTDFAKRWIAKRAYDYGWNNETFPKDRGSLNDYRDRPKIERIGKKYQWLALSEFLACITDNVWAVNDWPRKAVEYDNPADWLRDIEPSILNVSNSSRNDNPWWQTISLNIEPIQGTDPFEWPFQTEPPTTSDWIDVVSPDGMPGLLLYGLFNVRKDRNPKDASVMNFKRDIFVRITTLLVKTYDVDSAIVKLKNLRLADPTGHETRDVIDNAFLCEYPWRNTWQSNNSPYEEENYWNLNDIQYIRPVTRHVWESHLDGSLPDGTSVHLPHPWIGAKMNLKPNLDCVGEFVAETDGQTIFIDPTVGSDTSALLVNKEPFFKFLKDEGLECLWIVAGERNALFSFSHRNYACRSFAGVYRWTGKKWEGDTWHEDERRDLDSQSV